ncbi:MAG: DUF1318 domain-containing protein [Deltaproteobacteria bacterium]|nr:DUF1318 domain-containing protein [Deltaproteobacteria bacterium]
MKKQILLESGLVVLLLVLAVGCISAPQVVLLDHKTALEVQAAGEFYALEGELLQAGMQARAEDIPGSKLQDAGKKKGPLGQLAQLSSSVVSDAVLVDELLRAHCIGEASDGLLVLRPDDCRMDVDASEQTRVLERQNLHRRQLWRSLGQLEPKAGQAEVKKAWRVRNLQRSVCGALVQQEDGKWEAKKC